MSEEPEPWEMLQKARRKVSKWDRKAGKAVTGAKYQAAMIRKRHWEEQENIWFDRWSMS